MRTPSLLLCLALVAPLSAACGKKRVRPANLSEESKEQQLLSDSARLYWEALRWADSERAGAFIEDKQQRVLYRDWMEEHAEQHKLEDAQVLQVILGDELDPPVDGRLQTASVFVRTKGYSYPAQIVETARVEQKWFRSVNGWFVDWSIPDEADEAQGGGWR